jgi:hypothetical protein
MPLPSIPATPPALRNLRYFKNCEEDFLIELSMTLQTQTYTPREVGAAAPTAAEQQLAFVGPSLPASAEPAGRVRRSFTLGPLPGGS